MANSNQFKYGLVPNTLPELEGTCRGVFTSYCTVDMDDFAARAAAKDATLTVAKVKLVLGATFDEAADQMAATLKRIDLGGGVLEAAIAGSLPAADAPLGPENKVYVAFRPGEALRNCAAGVTPARVDAREVTAAVDRVLDVEGNLGETIVGTKPFLVTGRNLSVAGEDECIRVKSLVDGTTVEAEPVGAQATSQRVCARLPQALPPGKAEVCVVTHGNTSDDSDPRAYCKKVTVLADETPAGPTFAKVAPQGREDDDAYANKLLRNGKVAILGTGLTEGLVATFMNGGSEETFVVDEVTATKITGTIAGGLEVPGTLAFTLKDGDAVIGEAAVEVVEG